MKTTFTAAKCSACYCHQTLPVLLKFSPLQRCPAPDANEEVPVDSERHVLTGTPGELFSHNPGDSGLRKKHCDRRSTCYLTEDQPGGNNGENVHVRIRVGRVFGAEGSRKVWPGHLVSIETTRCLRCRSSTYAATPADLPSRAVLLLFALKYAPPFLHPWLPHL